MPPNESSSPREKNTPSRNEKEFYGVKNFLFLPKMRTHFCLKNKKVLGSMEAIFCPKTIRILSGLFLTPLLSPKNTSRRGLRIEVRKREEAPHTRRK